MEGGRHDRTDSRHRGRSERSHALAVSDAGGAAGFVEGPPNSLKSSAFLWRGSSLLTLNPPNGGKDAKAWTESRSGKFVAGDAFFGTLAPRVAQASSAR